MPEPAKRQLQPGDIVRYRTSDKLWVIVDAIDTGSTGVVDWVVMRQWRRVTTSARRSALPRDLVLFCAQEKRAAYGYRNEVPV